MRLRPREGWEDTVEPSWPDQFRDPFLSARRKVDFAPYGGWSGSDTRWPYSTTDVNHDLNSELPSNELQVVCDGGKDIWPVVQAALPYVYAVEQGYDPNSVDIEFKIDDEKEDPLIFVRENEEKFERAVEWADERGDDKRASLIRGLLAVARGQEPPEDFDLEDWE